jgi:hypothetical protein
MSRGPIKTTNPIAIRLPLELRDQLEEARKTSKRTQTEEIVQRLQASFKPRGEILGDKETPGGQETRDLFLTMSIAVQGLSAMGGPDVDAAGTFHWLKHPYVFRQAKQAIDWLLEQYRPEGSSKFPKESRYFVPESGQSEADLLKTLDEIDFGEIYAESIFNEIEESRGGRGRQFVASMDAAFFNPNVLRMMSRLISKAKLPKQRGK